MGLSRSDVVKDSLGGETWRRHSTTGFNFTVISIYDRPYMGSFKDASGGNRTKAGNSLRDSIDERDGSLLEGRWISRVGGRKIRHRECHSIKAQRTREGFYHAGSSFESAGDRTIKYFSKLPRRREKEKKREKGFALDETNFAPFARRTIGEEAARHLSIVTYTSQCRTINTHRLILHDATRILTAGIFCNDPPL